MVYEIICSQVIASDEQAIQKIAEEFEISDLRYDVIPSSHYYADRTHVYKYTLDGKTQFVELTDEERDAFEDKYNVSLSYWRD